MIKGQVISGEYGKVLIRQKSDENIELGELLVAENKEGKVLMQVFSLLYGSQISQQNLELISGLKLEEDNDLEFMDKNLRNYTLAYLKPLITISQNKSSICKILPSFFSPVREITKDDLKFITSPKNPLYVGNLRSGSKELDVKINLPGDEVFSHHILISGTTGRGKSVLLKTMLWSVIDKSYCGILVLDPHDEYYGRNKLGLKDHKEKDKVVYYTSRFPPAGAKTLKINLRAIRPMHFNGVVDFSDPQKQALNIYHKEFGTKWIEAMILEKKLQSAIFRDDTLAVVKRQLLYLLDLEFVNNQLACRGIFDVQSGETTISDICNELEQSKTVIIDTSNFPSPVELLIGSLVSSEIFSHYQHYKMTGDLDSKPVISIILEEAPRVLGKEVLEKGSNVFSTIAREGRKFKIGLTAITQLPSLIPRQILANINTKIILGIEMKPERIAIIESASQDLSEDDRNIASLDKGEAIITSNFTKFATPIKIPFFDDIVKEQKTDNYKKDFSGIV
jgi:uncharacterized protein